MSRTARLGAFILGALFLFGTGVFLIGERQYLFSRTYRLSAPFDTVAGLDDGAVVRSGGVRIGIVDTIHMPRRSGDKVTVDAAYVDKHIGDLAKNADLSRFIL